MLTLQELYNLNDKEIKEELKKARSDLYKIKLGINTTKEKATHKAQEGKKYIAKILTVVSQLKKEKREVKPKKAKNIKEEKTA